MKVTKIDKPGITKGSIKGRDLPKAPFKNVASVAAIHIMVHNVLPLGNKSHRISPKQDIVVEFITILSNLFTRFKPKEI